MAQKSLEDIDNTVEGRSLRVKEFNKFLDDYFGWIVAVVVILVFALETWALLLPKYEQTVRFIDSIDQQQSLDVTSKQTELDKINQLIAAYNKIDKKYITKVNAIAPAVQNKEELFSELNYLVSVNQLILQSISLSSASTYQDQGLLPIESDQSGISDRLQTVTIGLSVKGTSYEAFKNFLASLENNLRLMDILSIQFDPQGQSTSLIINTYYSKN
jgi:hypothetical protein